MSSSGTIIIKEVAKIIGAPTIGVSALSINLESYPKSGCTYVTLTTLGYQPLRYMNFHNTPYNSFNMYIIIIFSLNSIRFEALLNS